MRFVVETITEIAECHNGIIGEKWEMYKQDVKIKAIEYEEK